MRQAATDMLDWQGSGMSVMEMSHRGREFGEILARAQTDFRNLMAVPNDFHILFMQGGGIAENAIVPLNLGRGATVDFVLSGSWGDEICEYCGRSNEEHLDDTEPCS